jgi:DNA invertase Pin-like site-specific DNA recombinase
MATREQTLEGMRRAAERGRVPGRPVTVSDAKIRAAIPLGTAAGAKKVGLTKSQFIRRRRKLEIEEVLNGR